MRAMGSQAESSSLSTTSSLPISQHQTLAFAAPSAIMPPPSSLIHQNGDLVEQSKAEPTVSAGPFSPPFHLESLYYPSQGIPQQWNETRVNFGLCGEQSSQSIAPDNFVPDLTGLPPTHRHSDLAHSSVSMAESLTDLTSLPLDLPGSSPTKPGKPGHTPRPPNAWILYRSKRLRELDEGEIPADMQAKLDLLLPKVNTATSGSSSETDGKKKVGKDGKPLKFCRGKRGRGLPQAHISKLVSALWKEETPEVKQHYERLSELKKKEHQEMYPNYKFQPLRKEDKLIQKLERQREREERKREKEAHGRAMRNRRHRTRVSPLSFDSGDRRHRLMGFARSSSYSGPSEPFPGVHGQPPSWPTMSLLGGRPDVELDAEDESMRRYPFPCPPEALPSLRSETERKGHSQGSHPHKMSQQLYNIPQGGPLLLYDEAPSTSTLSPYRTQTLQVASQPHDPANGQSTYHPSVAMPYTVETIPGELLQIGQAPVDLANEDELAALWCEAVEDSSPPSPTTQDLSTASSYNFAWAEHEAQQATYLVGGQGAPYLTVADFSTAMVQLPPAPSASNAPGGSGLGSTDLVFHAPAEGSSYYITLADSTLQSQAQPQATSQAAGPALPVANPSPVEPWFPRESGNRGTEAPLGASSLAVNGQAAWSGHSSLAPNTGSTPFSTVPRYVSDSAYPVSNMTPPSQPVYAGPLNGGVISPNPKVEPDAEDYALSEDERGPAMSQLDHTRIAVAPGGNIRHSLPPRQVRRPRSVAAKYETVA